MIAACLLGVFVAAKALILLHGTVPLSAATPLAFVWQDVLFVLLFAAFEHATKRRRWATWAAYALVTAYVAVNVPVACELSTALTWPLVRATRGTLADSILHHVTPANVLRLGLVFAVALGLPLALRWAAGDPCRALHPPALPVRWRVAGWVGLAFVALLGQRATASVETLGLHRNVFVTLVASVFPRVAAQDVAGDWRASPFGSPAADDLARFRGCAAGRNVVLVHLESTGAGYLRPYGAPEDPMPNLAALTSRAILFENAYTTFPETIKSFVGVHCSVHPALDIPSESYEHVPTPSLAAVLREHGYRNGLFHSGRFAYLGMDAVVRGRGFDTAEDAGAIGGDRDSSFGIDEESTVRRILRWVDEAPGRPFFVTYLPIAGHHPYATPDGGGPFPNDSEINRYRNALHYADRALGQLLSGLRERGLDDSTLFVICGDHGEAFGQHAGNNGHTFFLYEENVRVPLVLAAPGLWGEPVRVGRVASLADTAPTVLDLLGLPAPAGYEGRSLLSGPARVALFCTDYALGLLGLRDGRWKAIHEVESGRTKLFDLEADPGEEHDVAQEHPERVEVYREHLLNWSAAQRFRLTQP
jgi:phosphoglycerol transferase MdoB-like AlkP superfamily enzyme